MSQASQIAAFVALGWAGLFAWLSLGAVLRRWQLQRRFRLDERDAGKSPQQRRVLMIRPCAGADVGLYDNLVSVLRVPTCADLRVVMTVDDPHDRARPIIERALAHLRAEGLDASLEIHPPTGPNRKASLLAGVLAGPAGRSAEFVVNVDSNVDLDGFPLDRLLRPLLDDIRLGAAWSPWYEQRTRRGLGPRTAEAILGGSLSAFPLLCGIHPQGLCGKIWAARRQAMDDARFIELTSFLGEDFEMARRLRANGWGIAVAPLIARSRGGGADLRQVIERFSRWMLVVRGQNAALMPTYPLFFFATPLILMLACFGLVARPDLALTAAAVAVTTRLMVAMAARYWSDRSLRPDRALTDAVLSDLVLLRVWLRVLNTREVDWRGHRLRIDREGRLWAAD